MSADKNYSIWVDSEFDFEKLVRQTLFMIWDEIQMSHAFENLYGDKKVKVKIEVKEENIKRNDNDWVSIMIIFDEVPVIRENYEIQLNHSIEEQKRAAYKRILFQWLKAGLQDFRARLVEIFSKQKINQ